MFYIYIGEMVTFLDIGEIALCIDENGTLLLHWLNNVPPLSWGNDTS